MTNKTQFEDTTPEGLFEMGKKFYLTGPDRQQDPQLAVDFIERSARMGFSPAQRLLGLIYQQGELVPSDLSLARQWLTMAAANGDTQAAFALALMYAQGHGVEKNWSMAHRILCRQDLLALPEALELKRRLKDELISLYPNISQELEKAERPYRLNLNRRQTRFILPFLDNGRSDNDHEEFDAWLSLNLGRLTANQALTRLLSHLKNYYQSMLALYSGAADAKR
ncbi:MAG: sel1 repeat family protein [Deltaproteobacteria bacterium]|jgi:hypothetical protein|nr:sel1 repeat family protein [Deltaproteobacteria bacterium]